MQKCLESSSITIYVYLFLSAQEWKCSYFPNAFFAILHPSVVLMFAYCRHESTVHRDNKNTALQ
jgi:hypothetical protein